LSETWGSELGRPRLAEEALTAPDSEHPPEGRRRGEEDKDSS